MSVRLRCTINNSRCALRPGSFPFSGIAVAAPMRTRQIGTTAIHNRMAARCRALRYVFIFEYQFRISSPFQWTTPSNFAM